MLTLRVESHGGALVNLIHSYTDNGDPFVRKFTDELLVEVLSFTIDESPIQFQTGFATILFYSAEVVVLRGTLRPIPRILCGGRFKAWNNLLCPPILAT